MEKLTDTYWSERYAAAQTGWDLGTVSPPLKNYFDQLTDKSARILIPGCGNAYEAGYLLAKNYKNITLIDISEVLTEKIKAEFSGYIEKKDLTVVHGDFFQHESAYDLIIEQTFFCALNPELRPSYAKKVYELLATNGHLMGVLFDREFVDGPPFGGNADEYRTYFEPYFNFKTFGPCHNSIPPRQGSELFIDLVKK